ncbi:MAG: N-acetylmuramoyl-L-alanine amidase [Alphaproteobacteria bacterium]
MKRVLLIVGHNAARGDRGAKAADGSWEHDFNRLLAPEIAAAVAGVELVQESYRAGGGNLARFDRHAADLIVELHCNAAASDRATGSEVLCARGSPRGTAAAAILQRHFVAALELPDRGVKPIGNRRDPDGNWLERGAYLLWGVRAPCLIGEPFFINNASDLRRARERRAALVAAYAAAIEQAAEKM